MLIGASKVVILLSKYTLSIDTMFVKVPLNLLILKQKNRDKNM